MASLLGTLMQYQVGLRTASIVGFILFTFLNLKFDILMLIINFTHTLT